MNSYSYSYVVICRGDRMADEPPAAYELATRRVFYSRTAAENYAAGIAVSREAIVVEGRWGQLRFAEFHNEP